MKLNRKLLIYVENISPTSSEQNLQAYLEKFAPVQGVYFLREKQCTKRSIAAFLRVANETDRDCIMLRNQQNYRGKRLFMLRADQPHDYQAEQTVIVRNITNKISEENLYDHFQDCGTIAFLQIRTDDFAYVTFEDKSSVKNAMSKNNQPLKGSSLKIQLLTRNLDIMIVSLDTLPSRMPDLYRMLIMPLEPRASSGEQQQQQQPAVQSQPPVVKQPQSQQQPKFQPNQQPQAQKQQQQQQQQSQQSRQQNQQQQQRENQQRLQRENQQLQQQAQAQQQRLQQQQQLLQQQRPLPQRQQNQRQQQQGLQQQQQQIQQQIQMLKEKANALAGRQQQQQQQQKQAVPEQPKPIPKPQEVPKKQQEVDPVPAASSSQSDTDDVQIVEIAETQQIIEDDDDDDEEVQIVEKPTVEPIPSDYVAKPDDLMRPVKASELVLKDVPKLKSEDDRRSVWVNNIQPETRRLDLILYMEQFGDVMHCKIGNSNNCAFTRWAKIMFTTEDGAARAAEYFLHPFQGRYLFVLQCSKYVVEEPGKVFAIDYLSKYVVYEDVVKAFKHIGEVFYLVRLYDNNYKVRIFFLNQVDEKAVLAVDSIDGRPAKLEPYIENMVLRLPKTLAKELKEAREIKDPEKEARMARITEIYKEEALDRYATREYTNPDPKTSPVEVVIYNVPVGTTDQQIKRFFKSIGEPTAIRRVPIETETHTVRDAECVYVGFRTLSMALQAAEISPERTLNSFNPFIFTAWSQAAMTDRNTIRLFFNKYIAMQDIYNGLIHCGQIKYIEKQRAKRALVVFGNGENGVLNAKKMNFIGDTKITCKAFTEVYTTADASLEDDQKIANKKIPVENLETSTPVPTSASTAPHAPDRGTYVFGTWRVSKYLHKSDRMLIDKFLLQNKVLVACLQEVGCERQLLDSTHYAWHHINSDNNAKTEHDKIKNGSAIVIRRHLMQQGKFMRHKNISTVHFRLHRNYFTVCSAHVRTEGTDGYPDPDIIELEKYLKSLRNVKRENMILLGHFNAIIGSRDSSEVKHLIGEHLGHKFSDPNGKVLKGILQSNRFKLVSSFGPSPTVQWTCTQSGQKMQVDHIIMPDIEWLQQIQCYCVPDHAFVSDNRMLLLSASWPYSRSFIAKNTKKLRAAMLEDLVDRLAQGPKPNAQPITPFQEDLIKKIGKPFFFATWNVSGCQSESDREIVDEFLRSHNIAVACLQETHMKSCTALSTTYRWFNVNHPKAGTDSEQIRGGVAILVRRKLKGRHEFFRISDNICSADVPAPWGRITVFSVYAPPAGTESQPDKEIKHLNNAIKQLENQQKKQYVVLGDLNAHFGTKDISPHVRHLFGDHLYHESSNANGKRIQGVMEAHNLKLISSFGPSPSVTSTFKRENEEAQVDHILMPQFDMLQNIQCRCIDGAPGFSDHRLLRMQTSYCTELAETSTGPEIAPLVHGSEPFSSTADPLSDDNAEKRQPVAVVPPTMDPPPVHTSSKPHAPPSNGSAHVFSTWNVCGCSNDSDREAVDQFLHSHNVSVACLQETQMPTCTGKTPHYTWYNVNRASACSGGSGGTAVLVRNDLVRDCEFQRISDNICSARLNIFGKLLAIASVHANITGVNGNLPDPAFQTLGKAIAAMPPRKQANFIAMGGFNAQIGFQDLNSRIRNLVGKHLYHPFSNANGEGLKLLMNEFDLRICNSFGPSDTVQCTWKLGDQQAQLDHILMPFIERFQRPKTHCVEGMDGFSEHRMLVLTVRHRLPKPGTVPSVPAKKQAQKRSASNSGAFVATRLDLHAEKKKKQAEAKQPPAAAIVIEDEDEVVVVPSDNSPDKNQNQKGQNQKQGPSPNKQQQQQGQKQKQQHQQQQQRQQQQRSGGNRNRNSNSFGDDGPPHRHQQQRNQMNPWQNNNQGPIWNDQFQRRDQFPHNDEFNFQRNQNPFMQGDRFNPDGGPFDRFGNQGPNRNMNMNEFEQMMMAQQFDNFNLNSNNGFNRGNPMDSDDPPLGRPWGQNQQNFDRFSPPGRRSPFNRDFPDDHDQDFDRNSPGIPSNIPEEDIDEYILRKQEAIKRRLEQLDRQLITSVETSRQRDFQRAARHRQGTVFSDNGDVHYVPNPAAVARNRGRGGRGGNFGGGRRGGGKGGDAAEGPSRGRGRRDRNELMKNRARDPFADVDIVPIIRISEDRSPSPKRSREDEFDAAQFNAAWN